eukprot:gb/GECH01011215.1/.p1 GENE.gb/GECH01011215.1/~~gb/GECH01011215.1/.p1  ORF type:complete len:254 (+),score=24.29 gb/GECH01011215.1/:1-762(+)
MAGPVRRKDAKKGKTSDPTDPRNKKSSLFVSKPFDLGIGNHVQPKKNVYRYVRWPKYIRRQRQKKILMNRIKVPPAIHQFNNTLSTNLAVNLFKVLHAHRPERKADKQLRLEKRAKAVAEGNPDPRENAPPASVKFGLKHVTKLVEKKEARLVVIAFDVDPIEMVVWLPALCRKMNVPYCIVKGKARLGNVVFQKTATCLALTKVKKEKEGDFEKLVNAINGEFLDNPDACRFWGGNQLSLRSRRELAKRPGQ